MRRTKTIGETIFWGATAVAMLLYWLTAPSGLPWQPASAANRYWRYLIAMAGGNAVALTSLASATAGGLLGAMANRYLGWRTGIATAIVWMAAPGVWNRAITGDSGAAVAAAIVAIAWTANAIMLMATRKARMTRRSASAVAVGAMTDDSLSAPVDHKAWKRLKRMNRIAGTTFLGTATAFAIVSASLHDYRLGEAASAYARLVVAEAGDRVILMNGICDAQIRREATNSVTISFLNTEANRSNVVAWSKCAWPDDTNLWIEATISPSAFARTAVKTHPERFYSMMGQSTTPERWACRWEAMKPYLKSGDKFIAPMRAMFAYEGNALGNSILSKATDTNYTALARQAWQIYYRVFSEIHPMNPAACVNLNEMLRRGYKTDDSTRQRIECAQTDYAKLMTDRRKARRVAEFITRFGPVMRDEKAYAELRTLIRKRLKALEDAGERPMTIPDLKTLEEWHSEMMGAFRDRDCAKSADIARAILSRREWRGFIPAHVILGEKMMMQGDWIAAEAFLRAAVTAADAAAPKAWIFNDYAETLRRLNRPRDAEKYARLAVGAADAKSGWFCKLTLAQVLRDMKTHEAEVESIVKDILKFAPREIKDRTRREFPQ